MKIGWILVAGLAAGLLINVSGISMAHYLLGSEYMGRLMAHMPGEQGVGLFLRHLGLRFLFGFIGITLYVLLRPRFASRATASLAAAAFLFCAAYIPMSAMLSEIGVLGGWQFWLVQLWGILEVSVALYLSSWLYERITR